MFVGRSIHLAFPPGDLEVPAHEAANVSSISGNLEGKRMSTLNRACQWTNFRALALIGSVLFGYVPSVQSEFHRTAGSISSSDDEKLNESKLSVDTVYPASNRVQLTDRTLGEQADVLPTGSAAQPLLLASNQLAQADSVQVPTAAAEAEHDWVYWRGPNFNGISRETGLVDDWNPKGGTNSNVKWKRDDLGGRSTPIAMNGKLYFILRAEAGTPREGEKVVCLDAASGNTLWENRFNVYLSDVPDTRVGWSSCVGDPTTGRIYALGVCGHFQCLDAETGKNLWAQHLHERFGLLSTYGGRTNFPVICEDLVIVSAIVIGWGDMAKPAHRFIAFDKLTGEVVWFNGTRLLPYDTTYSAPTLTVLGGQKALVFGSGDGAVWAIQPRTGEHIWQLRLSRRGLNLPPLVAGNRVFMGNGEENISDTTMGAVVAIDALKTGDITETGQQWRVDELMVSRSAPLLIDDRLWVFDDRAKLHILDANTGERIGRRIALGTVMRASSLYADGKVYAFTANGRWAILVPDQDKGATILKKGRLPRGEECHASPICYQGRIYLLSTGGLYCLVDPEKSPVIASDSDTASTPEAPVSQDTQPAHLQVVPADLLLRPGQMQKFVVKLFNSRGQFLRIADAQYSLEGCGTVDGSGSYIADKSRGHHVTIVSAKVGNLVGTARVRIVPPLPWNFDFEDIAVGGEKNVGEPPITWVGARYRHVVREADGNKHMVKVTTIPKGTRSRCWFGHSELSNYTIQADVRGSERDGKMPDIGLIAQGYTIDLQGASQRLQIRSWVPQLRMATTIDFPWQADVWYRVKFQAGIENHKAVLRGKVWPRDELEPSEWTIEATDEEPNRTGSPGLFGNAKDAEIFLDNIRVFANNEI